MGNAGFRSSTVIGANLVGALPFRAGFGGALKGKPQRNYSAGFVGRAAIGRSIQVTQKRTTKETIGRAGIGGIGIYPQNCHEL